MGTISKVPYAEPTWLTPGYYSPYYKEVRPDIIFYSIRQSRLSISKGHRRLQTEFRKFCEEIVGPDAQAREDDGKRPSQNVFDEMAKTNIIAMRMGPGPHLKGLELMGGIVKPEEASCSMSDPARNITLSL